MDFLDQLVQLYLWGVALTMLFSGCHQMETPKFDDRPALIITLTAFVCGAFWPVYWFAGFFFDLKDS